MKLCLPKFSRAVPTLIVSDDEAAKLDTNDYRTYDVTHTETNEFGNRYVDVWGAPWFVNNDGTVRNVCDAMEKWS